MSKKIRFEIGDVVMYNATRDSWAQARTGVHDGGKYIVAKISDYGFALINDYGQIHIWQYKVHGGYFDKII